MPQKKKGLSFEEALSRLEEIVEDLESNTEGIESALDKYEEGIKLYKYCYERLAEIQGRIEVLMKDGLNGMERKDFEVSEDA